MTYSQSTSSVHCPTHEEESTASFQNIALLSCWKYKVKTKNKTVSEYNTPLSKPYKTEKDWLHSMRKCWDEYMVMKHIRELCGINTSHDNSLVINYERSRPCKYWYPPTCLDSVTNHKNTVWIFNTAETSNPVTTVAFVRHAGWYCVSDTTKHTAAVFTKDSFT